MIGRFGDKGGFGSWAPADSGTRSPRACEASWEKASGIFLTYHKYHLMGLLACWDNWRREVLGTPTQKNKPGVWDSWMIIVMNNNNNKRRIVSGLASHLFDLFVMFDLEDLQTWSPSSFTPLYREKHFGLFELLKLLMRSILSFIWLTHSVKYHSYSL